MSVKVNVPSYLQPYTGGSESVEVAGSTTAECLTNLVEQFPGMSKMLFSSGGRLYNYVNIYVNGEPANADELSDPVKDGDELQILYVIGGG